MKAFHFILGISLFLNLLNLASAKVVDDYDFPIDDPFYATVTAVTLPSTSDDWIKIELPVIKERQNLRYVGKQATAEFIYYHEENDAPLIIIVPGFGSSASSQRNRWLAEIFYRAQFNVLVTPSPFHWRFIAAANPTGYAGLAKSDSKILYNVLVKCLRHIWSKGYRWKETGLVGYSGGGLNAAFMMKLDDEKKIIGFDRTLLINPAVSIKEATDTLDELYEVSSNWNPSLKKNLDKYVFDFFGKFLKKDRIGKIEKPSIPILNELITETPRFEKSWTSELTQYAIGRHFRETLSEMVFMSQLIYDLGVLKTPGDLSNPDERLKEAFEFSFDQYINNIVYRYHQEVLKNKKSLSDLVRENSMYALKDYLDSKDNIYVYHNLDDFIVTSDDLIFIRETFDDRYRFYPLGGHMGNLWYPYNIFKMLRIFLPLHF